MERVNLPEPARTLWRLTEKRLGALLDLLPDGRPTYRFGGGTMLAAEWNHRKSTDIDLGVPDGSGLHVILNKHEDLVREQWKNAGLVNLTERHLQFEFGQGRVEIFEADPRPAVGHRRVLCGETEIHAMTPAQILRGKLERALKHEPPARDLYDIAVARRLNPGALEIAVNMLTKDDRSLVRLRIESGRHRADNEAGHVLERIPDRFRKLAKTLSDRALAAFDDSTYNGIAGEIRDDVIVVEPKTRIGTRTLRIPLAEGTAGIERHGLTMIFERTPALRNLRRDAAIFAMSLPISTPVVE